ncbi:MAG: alpha/beta fold hydrolase, partial [Proteobacteria bacterium]
AGNPALVFFHAFPFDAEMWSDQVTLFSEKFYCVAVDLPGFGSSPLPENAFTFEANVDAVLAFLKEAKLEKSIWCGLSMGGYLALRLYERAPEHCRALILCDTKSGADGNEAKLKRAASISQAIANREDFDTAQWKVLTGTAAKQNAELKKRFDTLTKRTSTRAITAGLTALATRTDTTEGLTKISVPTLILVGAEDQVTPVKEAEALHSAIKGSQLKVISNAGHLSNLENPSEFNAAVSGFLAGLR